MRRVLVFDMSDFWNDTRPTDAFSLCHLEKPGHYTAYWYSVRVHIRTLLLSCISALRTDVTIFTRVAKKQPSTTQHRGSLNMQSKGKGVDQPFAFVLNVSGFPAERVAAEY